MSKNSLNFNLKGGLIRMEGDLGGVRTSTSACGGARKHARCLPRVFVGTRVGGTREARSLGDTCEAHALVGKRVRWGACEARVVHALSACVCRLQRALLVSIVRYDTIPVRCKSETCSKSETAPNGYVVLYCAYLHKWRYLNKFKYIIISAMFQSL